jgi:dolichol-phosphate mannosyltransferase
MNEKLTAEISIIVPLYNEEHSLDLLIERLKKAVSSLKETHELILVDDGSHDATWHKIDSYCSTHTNVRGVRLSRNFGQQNALFAGICMASGKAIITLDGDLQHPPEFIAKMIDAWQQGYKIVEARRIDSVDTPLFKRWSSKGFHWCFSFLSGIPPQYGITEFRLIDRSVAEMIREMGDAYLFLRGYVSWTGLSKCQFTFQVENRSYGKTKYSIKKLVRLGVGSLLSFSTVPLRFAIWIGFITSLFAFLELAYILVRYLEGDTVPGWASIVGINAFMFGMMFMLLGIMGMYLGSMCVMLQKRPRFLVEKSIGCDEN